MTLSLERISGEVNLIKEQVEGTKELLAGEVDRLKEQIQDLKGIATELRQMARQFVEVSIKIDRIIIMLDGTGPHDIGLAKRMVALENSAITKPQIAIFTAFIASIWGLASGILSTSIHWPWNSAH